MKKWGALFVLCVVLLVGCRTAPREQLNVNIRTTYKPCIDEGGFRGNPSFEGEATYSLTFNR
jgi:hypothetical protein